MGFSVELVVASSVTRVRLPRSIPSRGLPNSRISLLVWLPNAGIHSPTQHLRTWKVPPYFNLATNIVTLTQSDRSWVDGQGPEETLLLARSERTGLVCVRYTMEAYMEAL